MGDKEVEPMNIRLPNLNHVIISGNLTHDPDNTILTSGTHLLTFSLANNQRYKDKGGEWKDKPCFVEVKVWAKLAEVMAGKLHKGSPVVVEGSLEFSQWDDRDTGKKRSKISITAKSIQAIEKQDSNFDRNDGGQYEPGPVDNSDIPF